jgi:uncharacterized protein
MNQIRITVVFALPDVATEVEVIAPSGINVREAIERSGIGSMFPHLDLTRLRVGIWGKHAKAATTVVDGDRVEIYRPLLADVKKDRALRALR